MYKMNYFSMLLAVFVPCYVVFGQQELCAIPSNGGLGQCKSIFKCQSLLSLVNQAEKTLQEKDLLYKSYCGIDDDAPAVCCPKQNETQPCITPVGNLGECISLYSCPQIMTLLRQPLTDDKREFVRQSQCDGTDQYSVCCGPVPSFDVVKGNCILTAFPPEPRTECCGIDSSYQNKIVGGNATNIDQHPWLVMLEFNKHGKQQVYGMGALISGKYALAPASVANTEILGIIVNVILGEYDTSNQGNPDCVEVEGGGVDCTDGAVKIPVEKIIPHPEYNTILKINDISLIRMKQNALYSDFIRPICLPTADVTLQSDPFYLTAAGWGATSTKRSSNIKHQVDLPYVGRDQCQRAYSSNPRAVGIKDTHLCAGGEEGKDTCKGDATLVYLNGTRYEFVGIASFGTVPCGLKDIPGVYTNVYKYNNWIRKNIVP